MVWKDVVDSDAPIDVSLRAGGNASEPILLRVGVSGRSRRTWPQRFLAVLGLAVSAVFFGASYFFWQANVVLGEVPRISVGADVLAQEGDPGEPVNFLLVGVDSSEGLDPDDPVRAGREVEDEARGIVRPDTILVARLDPATGSVSMLSLPRDLIVENEGGTSTRLNATQAVGGIGSLITAIDTNLSIPINHFIQVDFAGFSDIVDIVGGVPVYFPFPTRDVPSGLSIPEAGCFNLNGSESLSYVRARSIEELIDGDWTRLRAAAPDLARIARQQEFMALTLEEVLNVGRNDLSQITSFIDAGVQAVQLDEQLTPGDMVNLAAAFSDFDTQALEVATIPVRASFSEQGAYLGEAATLDDAGDLLARFQGTDDGVRPEQVSVVVNSNSDRQSEQLVERGFAVRAGDSQGGEATTIRFDVDSADQARLLARYLEEPPRFEVVAGAGVQLEVGPGFAGVRVFPRPEVDVAAALNMALQAWRAEAANTVPPAAQQPPAAVPQVSPEATVAGAGETSVPGFAPDEVVDVPSSSVVEQTTTTVSAQQAPSPLEDIVRGRPPEGVGCGPTNG